jgi:crossover junction endodeoxyribonuclease RuvC
MKILAIDPGYERVGIAVLEKEGNNREVLVFSECFQTNSKLPFDERLLLIGQEIERVIGEHQPEIMAIEKLFFAKNQKTALAVSEARGVIMYAAKKLGLEIREFTPNEIKVAVTGYGKATKRDITFMLPKLIDVDVDKKIDDELDAIAVGLTCAAHHREGYPQK